MPYSGIVLLCFAFVLIESVLHTNAWTTIPRNGPIIKPVTGGTSSFRKRICNNMQKRTSDNPNPNSLLINTLKRQSQLKENLQRLQEYLQREDNAPSDYLDLETNPIGNENLSPRWNSKRTEMPDQDEYDISPRDLQRLTQLDRIPIQAIREYSKMDILDKFYRILLNKAMNGDQIQELTGELDES